LKERNEERRRWIRSQMVLVNVSGAGIGRQLGISRATVSNVIAGREVSVRVQRAIAEALKMDFQAVWGMSESKLRQRGRPEKGKKKGTAGKTVPKTK